MTDLPRSWSHPLSRLPSAVRPWHIGLLALAAALAIGLFWYTQHTSPAKQLVDLFERRIASHHDLDRIRTAFARSRLNGYRIEDGRVLVPQQQRDVYWQALEKNDVMPGDFYQYVERAWQSGNFFETQRDKKRRWDVAHEQQLCGLIEQIPGIEKAFVQFDESQTSDFPPRTIASALVAVVCRQGEELGPFEVDMIRSILIGAKVGLEPERVVISDLGAKRVYREGDDGSGADHQAHALAQLKRQLKKQWHSDIASVLDFIPQARIAVAVRLDAALAPDSSAGVVSHPPGEQVFVSISIPRSYLENLFRQRKHEATAEPTSEHWAALESEVRQKIEQAVGGLLPPAGEGRTSQIVVTVLDDLPNLARSPKTAPHWLDMQALLAGVRSAPTGLVAMVAGMTTLVAILVGAPWMRRATRRKRSRRRSADRPLPPPADHEDSSADESRQALIRLVRQDPDRAARVLNEWIRKAG